MLPFTSVKITWHIVCRFIDVLLMFLEKIALNKVLFPLLIKPLIRKVILGRKQGRARIELSSIPSIKKMMMLFGSMADYFNFRKSLIVSSSEY